jgi:hypothetical protein
VSLVECDDSSGGNTVLAVFSLLSPLNRVLNERDL